MKLYSILLKSGEAAPLFTEEQFPMADIYANLHDGKVLNFNTKEIIVDHCKEKHFEHLRRVSALEKEFEKSVHNKDINREQKYFRLWIEEGLKDK